MLMLKLKHLFMIKIIDSDLLKVLSEKASTNPRLRHNYNLHNSLDDICQRLLNAMEPGSYIRPHRHAIHPKPELFYAVAGELGLIIFSDDGQIKETCRLTIVGDIHGVEIAPAIWHTVISLKKGSVFLEVKPGPYMPLSTDEFAPWAPIEGTLEAEAYLEKLKSAM